MRRENEYVDIELVINRLSKGIKADKSMKGNHIKPREQGKEIPPLTLDKHI